MQYMVRCVFSEEAIIIKGKEVYGLDTSTGYCNRVYVGGGRVE